jgi:hypothetical protein
MKFILGVVAGAIGYWLYQSRGQQAVSSAPEFLQHARESVTSATTAGAQRTVEAFDRAPLPQHVKDVANRATSVVHTQSGERPTSGQTPDASTSVGKSADAQAQSGESALTPEPPAP